MPDIQQILIPILVVLTVLGVAYALFAPALGEANMDKKRREKILSPGEARAQKMLAKNKGDRRKHIAETLASLDEENKKRRKVSFPKQIKQAGLSLTPPQFILLFAGVGVVGAFFILTSFHNVLVAALGGVAIGAGSAKLVLKFLSKRRKQLFVDELPNAIDVVVRGIKSGLPLADCFRVIAREAKEPLRGEFREAVDAQVLGQSLGEALERMYERVPLAEVNFLAIVITIQQSSGGNLAEALANLSKVIRSRKMMREKINAVSQEAKASAAIIGALPLVVTAGLYFISPDYLGLMFTTELGNIMLAGCAVWMMVGVFVMAKMINFDI